MAERSSALKALLYVHIFVSGNHQMCSLLYSVCQLHHVCRVDAEEDVQDFVPELDFVMQLDDDIIGQVVFCRAEILSDDGRKIPILTFGPIGIAPEFKRKGYGLALLNYALDKARNMGFGAVCMEGNIDFYGKAGFVLASSKKIHYHGEDRSDPVPYFLCLELQEGYLDGIEGVYYTPKPYFIAQENPDDFELFDKSFPPKEKLRLPGQIF